MKKQKYSPDKATFPQLCRLRRDNSERENFAISTDAETVWLSEQRPGQKPAQEFELPRRVFNKLIRWYQRPQVTVRK